jgi:glycogen operon protein
MLVAGDELSRTQKGNNNAYCQDNEISWINWKDADLQLLQFTQKLIHLYKNHPVFSRRRWFQGQPIKGTGSQDIAWFKYDGTEMTEENWRNDHAKSLAVYMNGRGLHTTGWKGEQLIDDSFFYHFQCVSRRHGISFTRRRIWKRVDQTVGYTEGNGIVDHGRKYFPGDLVAVEGLSVVVLTHKITSKE